MTSDTMGQMLEQIPVPAVQLVPCQQGPHQRTLAFFVKGVWGGGPSGNGKSPMFMSTSVPSTRTEFALRPESCDARSRTPDDHALRGGGDPYNKGCCARPRTPDDLALCGEGDPYNGFTGLTGMQLLTLNRSDPVGETIPPAACCPELEIPDISAVSRTTPRPTPCL
jgi:hypothetical protein